MLIRDFQSWLTYIDDLPQDDEKANMKFNSFSLQNDDYYDDSKGQDDYNDDGKGQDDYYDDGDQGGEFLDYSNEDGDESSDYNEEEEKNPVLKMTDGKNRERIQSRLDKYHCQALSPLGTGESCQSSIECRCGEFCHTQKGVCEPAVCDTRHQGSCRIYPGFNSK